MDVVAKHGFFALRNNAAGRSIAAAHWDAWANVSAAYVAEDGECFGNRTAARWKQCRVGGKYAGQGAFKTYVLPRFRAVIAIVPDKTFQSADAQECDGVVKHFAAGRTAEALRLRTVERCAASYFRAPTGGAAAAPERPRAARGGGGRPLGRGAWLDGFLEPAVAPSLAPIPARVRRSILERTGLAPTLVAAVGRLGGWDADRAAADAWASTARRLDPAIWSRQCARRRYYPYCNSIVT